MEYTSIEVPHHNDSFVRVVIRRKVWELRFTYNNATDCWKFGIYDSRRNPLVQDIKIVPGIPLNHAFCKDLFPHVYFGVITKLDRIGYRDFWDGYAKFIFVELPDES